MGDRLWPGGVPVGVPLGGEGVAVTTRDPEQLRAEGVVAAMQVLAVAPVSEAGPVAVGPVGV